MATRLLIFDQYQMDKKAQRKLCAIDPKKVSFVRETAHGSIFIAYTQKFGFEVHGEIGSIVHAINEGRNVK